MAKAKRKATPQEATRAFKAVVECAMVHGWTTSLDYKRGRFTFDVFENHELIARSRSGLPAPIVFAALAKTVKDTLEKSGRLD